MANEPPQRVKDQERRIEERKERADTVPKTNRLERFSWSEDEIGTPLASEEEQ